MTFNKNYLYDGPWRVLWKTNTAWQKYFDPLNSVADNRAYQWYKEVSPERIAGREACANFYFVCFVVWRVHVRLVGCGTASFEREGLHGGYWVTLPHFYFGMSLTPQPRPNVLTLAVVTNGRPFGL